MEHSLLSLGGLLSFLYTRFISSSPGHHKSIGCHMLPLISSLCGRLPPIILVCRCNSLKNRIGRLIFVIPGFQCKPGEPLTEMSENVPERLFFLIQSGYHCVVLFSPLATKGKGHLQELWRAWMIVSTKKLFVEGISSA